MERAIEHLKKKIMLLSTKVEEMVWQSVKSLIERDGKLAEEVINGDMEIDCMEVEVEEECLKILALYQPVAIDMRFIVAVLKINNDLERIGDLAVNIAEQSVYLASQVCMETPADFRVMGEKTQTMLKNSLDALLNQDTVLAYEVCAADDEVDNINRNIFKLIKQEILNKPEQISCLIHLLSVSRHLERIADLATNIAEDLIYMIKGEIIRHKTEDFKSLEEDGKNK